MKFSYPICLLSYNTDKIILIESNGLWGNIKTNQYMTFYKQKRQYRTFKDLLQIAKLPNTHVCGNLRVHQYIFLWYFLM